MRIEWTASGWADYVHWQDADRDMVIRINVLIKDTSRNPFAGLGKPEPLRGEFAGWWSRRITSDHRMIYRITGKGEQQRLEIASCRFHYR